MSDSVLVYYVLFPALIFLARMADVTLGTLRIIMVSRGLKNIAPIVGFFEVLIWLLAIRQIMMNLTEVSYFLAYAGGFAAGNYIGMWVEEKLAMGHTIVRIITNKEVKPLLNQFRNRNIGVTCIFGQGAEGPVTVVFVIIKRKDLLDVIQLINQFNPQAFYSLEDVRRINEGIFPKKGGWLNFPNLSSLKTLRK